MSGVEEHVEIGKARQLLDTRVPREAIKQAGDSRSYSNLLIQHPCNFVGLYLEEIVSLVCQVAQASTGGEDDEPLFLLRIRAHTLLQDTLVAFFDKADPDGAEQRLLDQYQAQLISAARYVWSRLFFHSSCQDTNYWLPDSFLGQIVFPTLSLLPILHFVSTGKHLCIAARSNLSTLNLLKWTLSYPAPAAKQSPCW
jgi:hypothetical protein